MWTLAAEAALTCFRLKGEGIWQGYRCGHDAGDACQSSKNIGQYRQRTGLDNVSFVLAKSNAFPYLTTALTWCFQLRDQPFPGQTEGLAGNIPCIEIRGQVSVSDLALLKPLPDNVRDMAAALVGCVAGAVLVEETKALL